jgi:hypothetical protein
MDLRLYFRVIWRFRVIVAIGFVIACVLSLSSYARISFKRGSPTLSYRQSETWKATTLLFLTQKGFPYGYTILPYAQAGKTIPGAAGTQQVPRYATPGTFAQFAVYYAPFAQSDAFRAIVRKRTPVKGIVQAQSVLQTGSYNTPLPYINMTGFAANARDAVTLANTASAAFADYIAGLEDANKIPAGKRVDIEMISRAHGALLSAGRKKTTPIVVFLTVLLAAIGLSFVLENLRPRIRQVATDDDVQQPAAARGRSA